MLDLASIEHNSEGRPRSAKQIRRILKAAEAILPWWNNQPEPRPHYVRPWVIVEATGLPVEQLAPALRALGWERIQHRETGGVPRIYWLAPGAPSPVRAVGRPKGSGTNRLLPGPRTPPLNPPAKAPRTSQEATNAQA